MKLKKSDLISTYAQNIGIETAKELITKKIKAAALMDKEGYTEGEIAKICDELEKEGGLIRIVAQTVLIDLARKKSEEQALLLDNIDTQIWYLTEDNRYGAVNKAHAGFLGLDKSDLEHKSIYDVISRDEVAIYLTGNREVFEEKKSVRTEGWVTNGKGKTRLLAITKTPKIDDNENVEYVICAAEDITERKRADDERKRLLKELAAKNAELERFAYTVSHDLTSPLFAIRGFTSLVREDFWQGKTENAESYLKRIEDAAAKMDRLLNDTLKLSRIGRLTNPPEDASFGQIVEEALDLTSEHIKSGGVEVSVADDLPTVHVDKMRIVEMLVNLITNGIKYIGKQSHPKIDIGYRVEGKETVFFVKDNGIGIDQSLHEKVFELFYKVEKSSEGTGAGLAIVKRIIEVHEGRIWIESAKDNGCTVCFTLPVR